MQSCENGSVNSVEYVDSGAFNQTDRESKELDWIPRLDNAVRAVATFADSYHVDGTVMIELPDHYSAAKGEAAKNSSAILKLMALVFSIRERMMSYGGAMGNGALQVQVVPVRVWKGNVPKEITQSRVLKHWGIKVKDHNEADAIGIGDWYFRKVCKYSISKYVD